MCTHALYVSDTTKHYSLEFPQLQILFETSGHSYGLLPFLYKVIGGRERERTVSNVDWCVHVGHVGLAHLHLSSFGRLFCLLSLTSTALSPYFVNHQLNLTVMCER